MSSSTIPVEKENIKNNSNNNYDNDSEYNNSSRQKYNDYDYTASTSYVNNDNNNDNDNENYYTKQQQQQQQEKLRRRSKSMSPMTQRRTSTTTATTKRTLNDNDNRNTKSYSLTTIVFRVLFFTIVSWLFIATPVGSMSLSLTLSLFSSIKRSVIMIINQATIYPTHNSSGSSNRHLNSMHTSDSLSVLVRNCTGDLDGLISVIEDFFQKQKAIHNIKNQNNNNNNYSDSDSDNDFESLFRSHLKDVAAHRYRRLESGLEWVLGLYKFIFPLLIIQLIMKLMGNTKAEASSNIDTTTTTHNDSDSDNDYYSNNNNHNKERKAKRRLNINSVHNNNNNSAMYQMR